MPSNLDLILGGAQSAAQSLQPAADSQRAEEARNKPLSPYEKALGLVMSGKLNPREAAVRVKMGLPLPEEGMPGQQPAPQQTPPGNQGPQQQPPPQYQPRNIQESEQPEASYGMPRQGIALPPPDEGRSFGYQGMGGGQAPNPWESELGRRTRTPLGPQGAPSPMGMSGPAQGGQYPVPQYQSAAPQQQSIPGPQTRGDMQALQTSAPFIKAAGADTSDDKLLRAFISANSRERGQDITADTADKNRGSKEGIASEKIRATYAGLVTKLESVDKLIRGAQEKQRQGHGQNLELESMKLKVGLLKNQRDAIAKLQGSLGAAMEAPGVKEALDQFMTGITTDTDNVMKDLNLMQQKGTTRPSQQPTVTPAPEGSADGALVLPKAMKSGGTKTPKVPAGWAPFNEKGTGRSGFYNPKNKSERIYSDAQ